MTRLRRRALATYWRTTISLRINFLVLLIGRQASMRTRSPTLHCSNSSCAANLLLFFISLMYLGCGILRSTRMVAVFCAPVLTTLPSSTCLAVTRTQLGAAVEDALAGARAVTRWGLRAAEKERACIVRVSAEDVFD
eukprot:CAMPEP_0198686926 /NCGR_PEP_ID=MMETSP1468-20131203/31804_1 /TAXON_ID=1461545 /ORGANISM="Mantoniella sp, Strain CCMP1436" /LENGTH=136 /DNA_ID=CAMNT_0044433729 /DNA_START=761 /DNA_END=1168 /DNA_ORIENTATION=-